jgi:hypothetical protein
MSRAKRAGPGDQAAPKAGPPKPIAAADPDADEARANRLTRSQSRLERRAACNGWASPEREKRAIIAGLIGVCKGTTADGKTAKLRSKLIAARTLISADLRQQQLELEREIAAGTGQEGTLAELVGASEAIAQAIDRQRSDAGGAGPADEPASPLLP